MAILNFDIEAHRDGGSGPLTPVSIDATEVSPRARIEGVRISDISEAFNAMPEPVSDFAYRVHFSLSHDFEDSDPIFDDLESCGFNRALLIAECRARFADLRQGACA